MAWKENDAVIKIQVIFIIEEIARNEKMLFDFNGINRMKNLEIIAVVIEKVEFIINEIPQIGIIFCMVDKIKILFQFIFLKIENTHLWNGIIPNLIRNEIEIKIFSRLFIFEFEERI